MPNTDAEVAVRFLEWKRPGGPWPITAIVPDDNRTPTTWLESADAVRTFLAKHSGRANLHYTVAEVRPGVKCKPRKEELTETQFLHADLDPPETLPPGEIDAWIDAELERIRKLTAVPAPSLIACSGNGLHLLWRLEASVPIHGMVERRLEVESRNRWLVLVLNGDGSTWNCDRLLKVYGSINLPNAKKRKAGRVQRETRIIDINDNVHSLADFREVGAEAARSSTGPAAKCVEAALGEVARLTGLDELPDGVSSRIRTVIGQGRAAEPERYPSRSEAVCAVTRELMRAGCDNKMIAGVLLNPEFGISESILERGTKAKAEAAREIASARDDVGAGKPRIRWSEVELSRCLDEAEAALMQSGLPVYQMGDRLVQVVKLTRASGDEDAVQRAAGSLVIAPLPKHRLLEHFLTTAHFVKVSRSKDGSVKEAPFAPPLSVAETYMARLGAWRVPLLTGIATTPTMRGDGSVVSADGYDPASGLIIDTQGVAFPPVPDAPSKADGRAALDKLIDVIVEFPFVSDDEGGKPGGDKPSQSRSAALAMILTAVARPMFSAAPMFGISAPTMATGKSLLADVPAMIVTGRRATKMSQGASEEEDEKRLLSVLMQGDPVNVIDNIARPIEGDAMCMILTEETWRCRVLGRSEMRNVGTRALFIATGNNLNFRNDMASRAVLATLDAELENPGERVFHRDLKTYVPEHRGELAVAALTVLRAYIAAGRPKVQGLVASRFDDWAAVRAALVWLGEPDPWATNARVAVGDEARAGHRELMGAIGAVFGLGEFLSTTEIIGRAGCPDGDAANLHLALAAALPHGVTAPGLGRLLNKLAGRRVEGLWIHANQNPKKGNRYAMMAAAPAEPDPSPAQGQMFSMQEASEGEADAQRNANVPL